MLEFADLKEFAVNPVDLADRDGMITFAASIKGNHYGLARLIYHAPLLMGRNARYKVNGVTGNSYDLTLTAGLSGSSHAFEMFPFSTKYGGVAIKSEDGPGRSHTSKNKNQRIECDWDVPVPASRHRRIGLEVRAERVQRGDSA
jgi:hypothetical protein